MWYTCRMPISDEQMAEIIDDAVTLMAQQIKILNIKAESGSLDIKDGRNLTEYVRALTLVEKHRQINARKADAEHKDLTDAELEEVVLIEAQRIQQNGRHTKGDT